MLNKKVINITLCLLFLFCSKVFCSEQKINKNLQSVKKGNPDQYFEKGNELYSRGLYMKAIQEYKKILDDNIKNPIVYYNLGNAYYKNGNLGLAITNYERAKLYIPRDDDLNINLEFVKLSVKDKTPETTSGVIDFILLKLTESFTLNELTVAFSLIYFLIFISLSAVFVLKKDGLKFMTVSCLLVFVLVVSPLVYKVMDVEYTSKGIIIVPQVEVRSGPGSEHVLIFTLHEGTKVEILEKGEEYYEIILPNKEKGWILREEIEII